MFDKRVTDSDKFIDLPNSSKALYFMAGMEADDKGFFQPRRLQKLCGFTDDDFKILIAKSFFIAFESGVMVVTDWNKNNWLDSRRVTETEYIDELNMLNLINNKYELANATESKCLANAKPMLRENSIEENSIEENSIEENSIYNIADKKSKKVKHKYGDYGNVYFTDEQYEKLKKEFPDDYEKRIQNVDDYVQSTGKKYKDYLATIRTWARRDKQKKTNNNSTGNIFFDILREEGKM